MARTQLSFEQIKGNVVSVKDYGAVGDGVTDDTAAIQAALNTGGMVFLPEGTYIISQTLTVSNRQTVYGEGKYKSFIKASAASTPSILITTSLNDEYIHIHSLGFQIQLVGSTGDVTQQAIKLLGTRRSTFEHCFIDNVGQSVSTYGGIGILMDMSTDTDAYTNRILNNTVLGCSYGLWTKGPLTSSVIAFNQFKTLNGIRLDRENIQAGTTPIVGNQIFANLIQSHSSATHGTGNGIDFGQSDAALGFVYAYSNHIFGNYIEQFLNGIILRDGSRNFEIGSQEWDNCTNEIVDLNTDDDGYSGLDAQNFQFSIKDQIVTLDAKGIKHTAKSDGTVAYNGYSDTLNVDSNGVTIATDQRRIRVTGNGAPRTGAILSRASAVEGQRITLIGHSWSVALATTGLQLAGGAGVTLGNGTGEEVLIEFEYDSSLDLWVECFRNTRP